MSSHGSTRGNTALGARVQPTAVRNQPRSQMRGRAATADAAHGQQPAPASRGRKMFNQRERVQARLDARQAMQPHLEAIDVLRRQRNERIAAHQDEPRAAKREEPSKRAPAAGAEQPAAKAPPIPRFKKGPLKPIREATPGAYSLDATRKLDPYLIRERFGDEQLPRALSMQTENNLGEAVDVVEQKTGKRYTGSKTSRAEMYHWILANMGKPTPPAAPAATPLVAVGPVDDSLLTPQGRLNPYALYRAYGEAQTRRLLTNQVISDLKRSVAFVEARNPATKPTNRRAKASLVEYIMANMGQPTPPAPPHEDY
jgi:hypothetical protein